MSKKQKIIKRKAAKKTAKRGRPASLDPRKSSPWRMKISLQDAIKKHAASTGMTEGIIIETAVEKFIKKKS